MRRGEAVLLVKVPRPYEELATPTRQSTNASSLRRGVSRKSRHRGRVVHLPGGPYLPLDRRPSHFPYSPSLLEDVFSRVEAGGHEKEPGLLDLGSLFFLGFMVG